MNIVFISLEQTPRSRSPCFLGRFTLDLPGLEVESSLANTPPRVTGLFEVPGYHTVSEFGHRSVALSAGTPGIAAHVAPTSLEALLLLTHLGSGGSHLQVLPSLVF